MNKPPNRRCLFGRASPKVGDKSMSNNSYFTGARFFRENGENGRIVTMAD